MQVHHKGYRIRGFYRVAQIGYCWAMRHPDCHKRLKILSFFDKHGLAATQDAFGVSRRTLYRWKAALKAAGGDASALTPRSCAPKRKRRPMTFTRCAWYHADWMPGDASNRCGECGKCVVRRGFRGNRWRSLPPTPSSGFETGNGRIS